MAVRLIHFHFFFLSLRELSVHLNRNIDLIWRKNVYFFISFNCAMRILASSLWLHNIFIIFCFSFRLLFFFLLRPVYLFCVYQIESNCLVWTWHWITMFSIFIDLLKNRTAHTLFFVAATECLILVYHFLNLRFFFHSF